MKKLTILLMILSASLLANNSVNAASFNCEKASGEFEKTVCSDSNLSILDEQLAQTYKEARSKSGEQEQLKKTQLEWIKSTRKCASNVECIDKAYKERVSVLNSVDNQQSNSTKTASLDGKYIFNGEGSKNELQVKNAGVGQIKFSISTEGISVDEMGSRCVGGIDDNVAKMKGSVATFTDEDGCKLVMDLKGDNVVVQEQNCSSYHGAQCTFDGTYSNATTTNATEVKPKLTEEVASASTTNSSESDVLTNLQEGIEYIYYSDGSCTPQKGYECVSFKNYQQLCSVATGATELAVKVKAENSSFNQKTLLKGGDINKIEVNWSKSNGGDFYCYVDIYVSGMVNGNSMKENVTGVASHFKKMTNGKILVTSF